MELRCVSVCVCWVWSVLCCIVCVACLFVCVCASISWAILSLIKTDASQAVSGTHAPLVTPNNNPTEREMGEEEKQVKMILLETAGEMKEKRYISC